MLVSPAYHHPTSFDYHYGCNTSFYPQSFSMIKSSSCKSSVSPKRPILVIQHQMPSTNKSKKKVVFADDKGMSLTHVRHISEPPHVPPLWSLQFLAEITNQTFVSEEKDAWEITFPQPASDYVEFRKKLNDNNVSLENVIVKDAESLITGTVKVANLSYQKEVIVRLSFDDWKTYEDVFCTFVPNNISMLNGTKVMYDTFSFSTPILPKANRLQFCICFRSEGHEFWDSNDGQNYTIVRKLSPVLSKNFTNRQENKRPEIRKPENIVSTKMESWSEFASWNHLENRNPYW